MHEYETQEEAIEHANKKIAEKLKHGYHQVVPAPAGEGPQAQR